VRLQSSAERVEGPDRFHRGIAVNSDEYLCLHSREFLCTPKGNCDEGIPNIIWLMIAVIAVFAPHRINYGAIIEIVFREDRHGFRIGNHYE
jgi:hypothetical protein